MTNITPARHCIQNIVFEYIQQVEQLQDEGVRHGPCPSESPGPSSACAFSGNEYGQDDGKIKDESDIFVHLIF